MAGLKDHYCGDTPALYPGQPGWKERDGQTSRLAAQSMLGAATIRAAVLAAILAAPQGMTADEVARQLNQSVLAIRPRVTELGAQRRIVKSGRTRPNESGRQAAVWIQRGAQL